MNTTVSVRVSKESKRRLKIIAAKQERSMTEILDGLISALEQ